MGGSISLFHELISDIQSIQKNIEENMQDRVGKSLDNEIVQPMLQEGQALQQVYETFQQEKSAIQGMLSTVRTMI